MTMPWDELQPEDETVTPPEPELPYVPPPVYEPPPNKPPYETPVNLPDISGGVDFGKILKDAFAGALVEAGTKLREGAKDYVGETWDAIKEGETVDVLHPTITGKTQQGKELIIADAKSRSWRTLVQGLAVDVLFAIVAATAMLTGNDPLVKETWIAFGALLLKSVLSAIVSYFMRLKVTPTIRTPGEKMAMMPVPRPMVDEEWKAKSA